MVKPRHHAAFAVISALTVTASAAEYHVDVYANFIKPTGSFSMFGITDATVPVHFEVEIDTALGDVTTLPAGTLMTVGTASYALSTDATFVRRDAITSFVATIGTATWSLADLVETRFVFTNSPTYALLLVGDFADGAVVAPGLLMSSSTGLLQLLGLTCPTAPATCVPFNSGFVRSAAELSSGALADVTATITAVTMATRLASLSTYVGSLPVSPAIQLVLQNNVILAEAALGSGNPSLMAIHLDRLVRFVSAQSGKGISADDADVIIARVQAVLASAS